MNNTYGIICEVIILIFNVLIFMNLTVMKKNTAIMKTIMYVGSALIIGIYFFATYFLKFPESIASFVLVTIPTAVFFWILSKFKDARFLTTFCFLDTITYIIAFFARAVEMLFGTKIGIVGYIVACALMACIYFYGKPFFKRYRDLLRNIKDGWALMATSTVLIYVMMIFLSAFPKPIAQRIEYLPSVALVSITVLAFYAVFIANLLQKRVLSDLNVQLMQEKKWHRIAYKDVLTLLDNRLSYIEKINTMEREFENDAITHAVMIDVDNFKKVNDTMGHAFGDTILQKTADFIRKHFPAENCKAFRIGGDEFAVIVNDIPSETLDEMIKSLADISMEEIGCSLSIGYSRVRFGQNKAMETAFENADKNMYLMKEWKITQTSP